MKVFTSISSITLILFTGELLTNEFESQGVDVRQKNVFKTVYQIIIILLA